MVYLKSWSEISPTDQNDANQLATFITDKATALRERLERTGMYFPSTHDENAGEFTKLRMKVQSSNPAGETNYGFLFTKLVSTVEEVFYVDGSDNVVQLTSQGTVLGVPVGGIIIYDGDSCPTGFTQFSTLNGKFLVGAAARSYAAGGANTKDLRHVHEAGTLAASVPYTGWSTANGTAGGSTLSCGKAETEVLTTANKSATVSGSTGQSTTDLSAVDIRPEYAEVLLCKRT